jgi:enoyl-CoA hydratase/carnithine racemase
VPGCQLALACDLMNASEDATFREIFARIGLPLEGGAARLSTRPLSAETMWQSFRQEATLLNIPAGDTIEPN